MWFAAAQEPTCPICRAVLNKPREHDEDAVDTAGAPGAPVGLAFVRDMRGRLDEDGETELEDLAVWRPRRS